MTIKFVLQYLATPVMMGFRSFLLSLILISFLNYKIQAFESQIISCSMSEGETWIQHQFECSNFFHCDGNDTVPSLLMRCPFGRIFSGDLPVICQDSAEAKCTPQITTIPLQTLLNPALFHCPKDSARDYVYLLPVPSDCNTFYKCYQGQGTIQRCPENMYFDPVFEVCDFITHHSCNRTCQAIPEPQCPPGNEKPTYLPHPKDCDAFYQCNWGTPILQKCPPNLYFNPVTNTCDWTQYVECNRC